MTKGNESDVGIFDFESTAANIHQFLLFFYVLVGNKLLLTLQTEVHLPCCLEQKNCSIFEERHTNYVEK